MQPIDRVLYLCPELPHGKSSGGSHAHRYFIDNIGNIYGDRLDVIGLTHNIQVLDTHYTIHQVVDAKPTNTANRILKRAIRQFFSPLLPNKVTSRMTSKGLIQVNNLIKRNNYKLIIIDHFDAISLIKLRTIIKYSIPFIYIAHNIEKKLVQDLFRNSRPMSIQWTMMLLDIFRTTIHENWLMKHALATIFLSKHDMSKASERYRVNKSYFHVPGGLPEKKNPKYINSLKLNLLFSCNINFFPNRLALEWIATKLSPQLNQLDDSIVITVTGIKETDVPASWRRSNLRYKGFLSTEYFREVINEADGLLCPIEFGSGLKMKILEGIQAGLPVFATTKSWRGLEEIGENYVLPSSHIEAAIFIRQFTNKRDLETMREIMIDRYRLLIETQQSCSEILNEITENYFNLNSDELKSDI